MEDIIIESLLSGAVSISHIGAGIPIVRNIKISNNTDKSFEGLSLKITFSPKFATETVIMLPDFSGFDKINLDNVNIVADRDYMGSLCEKEIGSVIFSIFEGDTIIAENTAQIDILPFTFWSGTANMPHLLASFVMPNHPAVTGVLPVCGRVLTEWIKDPSITGYSTGDRDVVKKQAGAAYEALKREKIAYALPPASYETMGQKIRLPEDVLGNKMGTCLDLSLLYASLLESMRLNPIVILMRDHAYVGVWLEDKTYPECVIDDVTTFNKRCAEGIDEILLVETTTMCAGKDVPFEDAIAAAKMNLLNEGAFMMAVDVKRCRGSRILPLPIRAGSGGLYRYIEYDTNLSQSEPPKELLSDADRIVLTENVLDKQTMWERKLLDLSLRNLLLNFRVNKSVVQLMTDDLGRLEDALISGKTFGIYPIEENSSLKPSEDKIYFPGECIEDIKASCDIEFKNGRIRSFLKNTDLTAAMKTLKRKAKVSIEESGSNTLYLAMGFLKWYESDISVKERYAPLILVPVDITKKIQDKNYSVKIRDEESMVNITLLEFLRQNFGMDIGGLDPLPTDENGTDIKLVLNTVRKAIMENSRWDVCDIAFLGSFSFNRFIMWNDLRNRSEEILSNKIVKGLISGEYDSSPVEQTPLTDLDVEIKPADLAVVMSADSSQLESVYAASKGESFVLHGPPGTGKSQTITNMIATALYHGKSVLFVAEKMAALSVVQNRLEKVGLGPYCLEIHSNKASKGEVLAQLERTLEANESKPSEIFYNKANDLLEARLKLNDVMVSLHIKTPIGFSVFELIGMYSVNREFDNIFICDDEFIESMSEEKYDECIQAMSMLAKLTKECGSISQHPLREFYVKEYSMQLRRDFISALEEYRSSLRESENIVKVVMPRIDDSLVFSRECINYVENLIGTLLMDGEIIPALIENRDAVVNKEIYIKKITAALNAEKIKDELLKIFKESILTYDELTAKAGLIEAKGKWVLSRNKMIKSLVAELKARAIRPDDIKEADLEMYYDKITDYKNLSGAAVFDEKFTSIAGIKKPDGTLDYKKLSESLNKNISIVNVLDGYPSDTENRIKLCGKLKDGSLLEYIKGQSNVLSGFIECGKRRLKAETVLMTDFGFRLHDFSSEDDFIGKMCDRISTYIDNAEELKSYVGLVENTEQLKELGLIELVEALFEGKVNEDNIRNAFDCGFARSAAEYFIKSEPALTHFNGVGFTECIDKLAEISGDFMEMTCKEVEAKLAAKVRDALDQKVGGQQIAYLKKQIKSGRKAEPTRAMFNKIGPLLHKICPCMLMSPMSVAQYIDPSFPKFDYVIFDEASQLPTGEAVGAIARGENAIIVGDPKQLPPTTFFETNQTSEENPEIEDLESLLDDCLALSIPQRSLLWHYRSRHESLIAYSNIKYYDNKLYTFPSPSDIVSEVKFIKVDGFYDRGKTKQNKAEAQKIVGEITRRLMDDELCKHTMGVVTFSVVQQNLIEDMLNDALAKDENLAVRAAELPESIFVKNLENVQGDERDIIMFSIGYGPDKDGIVGMNFGPLNQEGGWRRLNVAISRAREEMLIFSTLTPEKIDLSKTDAPGVEGLKGFLEFAMLGNKALFAKAELVSKQKDDVARSIAAKLKADGIRAEINVGTSKYRVDIGIVDPDDENKYILGILLDGENYMRSKTANDRNVLQPSVLTGLGWNLHRVWTLDWFDTPDREYRKILEVLDKIKKYDAEEEKGENQV